MRENAAEEASDHHEDPCRQGPEGSVELMERDDDAMHFSDPISLLSICATMQASRASSEVLWRG